MSRLLLKGLLRRPATIPAPKPSDELLQGLADRLDQASRRRLGRSLAIHQIDAGSCNGCELEIHALSNAVYDLERFGIRFVASPNFSPTAGASGL